MRPVPFSLIQCMGNAHFEPENGRKQRRLTNCARRRWDSQRRSRGQGDATFYPRVSSHLRCFFGHATRPIHPWRGEQTLQSGYVKHRVNRRVDASISSSKPRLLRAMACRTRAASMASKGFGSKKNVGSKKVKQAPPGWTQVGRTSDLVENKPIKAVDLGRNAVVLVRSGEEFFCTDAKSTAYQFPLVDANLVEVEGKPAIECPLDGTVYDLRTGKVLEWCPKNNVIRAFLGKLKEKEKPVKLQTYPLSLGEDGEIYVKL